MSIYIYILADGFLRQFCTRALIELAVYILFTGAAAAADLRAAEPRICGPRFFNKQIFTNVFFKPSQDWGLSKEKLLNKFWKQKIEKKSVEKNKKVLNFFIFFHESP